MDWARAKNIILILLVLLNIFLFINVMNVKSSFTVTKQYQKNVKQALESSGVIVAGNIPDYNGQLGRISYIEKESEEFQEVVKKLTGLDYTDASGSEEPYWENERKRLQFLGNVFVYTDKTGADIFNIEDEKKLNKQIIKWIRAKGLSNRNFTKKSIVENGNIVTAEYIQQYSKLPLFSNKLIFTIEDSKLTRVDGSMRIFYDLKHSKQKDEIISPNIVLLTSRDKVQGVINSIVLGYLRPKNEELYDVPVWQVILHSGNELFFNAYTGEYVNLSH
ncbi:MAG: hypothetical protein GX045_03745 [Clostridiaceae bacterium]|jgi:regulatory protein YycI of two-component signal transduction system YycFG|nr:hypothetical protein [Clostridiaceae bacterium]